MFKIPVVDVSHLRYNEWENAHMQSLEYPMLKEYEKHVIGYVFRNTKELKWLIIDLKTVDNSPYYQELLKEIIRESIKEEL